MSPQSKKIHFINKIITSGSEKQILNIAPKIKSDHYSEILDALDSQEIKRFVEILFKSDKLYEIVSEIPDVILPDILDILSIETLTHVLTTSSEQLASIILRKLPKEKRELIFDQLPIEYVKTFERFILYPSDSCGYIMSTDFFAAEQDEIAENVVKKLRSFAKSDRISYIFVLHESRLVGIVPLRVLFLTEPETPLRELMTHDLITVNAHDDKEKAAALVAKHNFLAIPVVGDNMELLGILKVDDVVDVIRDEFTEDIQKFGGTQALDEPYINISFRGLMQKRAGWLIILFISEMLTATAMAFFQVEIEKAVVLALFVPLIISSGGNSGSQASTLVIRSLAIGEIVLKDWIRVFKRELAAGVTLGLILGTIGFTRIVLWSQFSNIYGPHWLLLAITIFLSLIGVVLWGTLTGSMLPFLLKKLGFDPASSSAPFVATLVDVTGLIIYFSVASLVLFGTLLK